jgi:hypothetical protein
MENDQMVNLVNFTLLFRKESGDSAFEKSHISYIIEKYDKMIGFEPTEDLKELNPKAEEIKSEWENKWRITSLSKKEESIVNYLCDINSTKGLDVPKMVKIFEIHIGDLQNINKERYGHLHVMFKNFVNMYIDSDNSKRKNGFKFIDRY